MTKIRLGIFQTNSSSVHCITIGGGQYDNLKIKDNISKSIRTFKIPTYLEDDRKEFNFGWGYEEYEDIPTKLAYSYLWNKLCGKENNIKFLELLVITKLRMQGYNKVKEIKWEYDIKRSEIDHQSLDNDKLERNTIDPSFIFGKLSKLIISNDNIGPDEDFTRTFYLTRGELWGK